MLENVLRCSVSQIKSVGNTSLVSWEYKSHVISMKFSFVPGAEEASRRGEDFVPAARRCRVRPGVATRDRRPKVCREPLPDAATQAGLRRVIAAVDESGPAFRARATVTPCAHPIAIVLRPKVRGRTISVATALPVSNRAVPSQITCNCNFFANIGLRIKNF